MSPESLHQLAALSVDMRCASILERGHDDLSAARTSLRDEFRVVHDDVSVERLAWAVAFNVAPPAADAGGAPASHGYTAHWPGATPWRTVWSTLTEVRPDRRGGPGTTLLKELACSVACERRVDWQPAGFTSRDHAIPDRAFEAVHARYRAQVAAEVNRRFGSRAGDPDAIADEAWSRVFRDYWSTAARRRFAGLCRIPTLVSQVAAYCAIDLLRQRSQDGERYEPDDDGSGAHLAQLSNSSDPTDRLISAQTIRHVRRCVKRLPARQQLAVQLVWFREVKAVEAARLLAISEPAVSQMLKRAREGVRACLGEAAPALVGASAGAPLSSRPVLRLLDRRNDADRR